MFAEELPGGLTRMVWFDHRIGRVLHARIWEQHVQAYGQCDGAAYAVACEAHVHVVRPRGSEAESVVLDLRGVNCMDLRLAGEREILVLTGHHDGALVLTRVADGVASELWRLVRHDAMVTSVAFLGAERIVSGGGDRAVRITPLSGGPAGEAPGWPKMQLTLRCHGVISEGVSTERERGLLEKYAIVE